MNREYPQLHCADAFNYIQAHGQDLLNAVVIYKVEVWRNGLDKKSPPILLSIAIPRDGDPRSLRAMQAEISKKVKEYLCGRGLPAPLLETEIKSGWDVWKI